MSVEAIKDVVRVVFEGFNNGDVEQVGAICAHDFVLEDIPAGLTLRGPEGMRAWLSNWLPAAPGARAELKVTHGEGDLIATEHHIDLWFGEFSRCSMANSSRCERSTTSPRCFASSV